jgi:pyruvate formate lyase activating enzyme
MVDFPGKLAATVFTGGCNLRCPFCHNALLVNRLAENPETHSVEEVLDFLKKRRGLLDGVVLSGGEPLMQSGAAEFLEQVRSLGYAVKLDTNGCYPEELEEILKRKLVDYVAMDIKNSREKYGATVGIPGFDVTPIEQSAALLKNSGIDFEFRTTVVKEFHTAQDIVSIGQWLAGSPRYYLQQFVDSGDLVGTGCTAVEPLELQGFADLARPFFSLVELRGV